MLDEGRVTEISAAPPVGSALLNLVTIASLTCADVAFHAMQSVFAFPYPSLKLPPDVTGPDAPAGDATVSAVSDARAATICISGNVARTGMSVAAGVGNGLLCFS